MINLKILATIIILTGFYSCNNKQTSTQNKTSISEAQQSKLDSINFISQNFAFTATQAECLNYSSNLRNRFSFFIENNQIGFIKMKTINDANVSLSYFDFSEDTFFNFIKYNDKIIWSNEESLYKTTISRELKDWDNDGIIEYIEKYKVCEAGCVSEKKYEIIYGVFPDSVFIKHRTSVITK